MAVVGVVDVSSCVTPLLIKRRCLFWPPGASHTYAVRARAGSGASGRKAVSRPVPLCSYCVPGSCACAQAVDSSQPDRAKDHLSKSLAPEHMARAVNRTAVGSSQRRVQARAEAHRRAVLEMGIFEVLLLCEIAVKDKSQPFHPTAKLHTFRKLGVRTANSEALTMLRISQNSESICV